MGGLRRGMGQRDRPVEGSAGFLIAAELHQEGTPDPEEMEIAGERLGQGLDHLEPSRGAAQLGDRHGPVEAHHRRRLQPLQQGIELVDLGPVGLLEPHRMGMDAGNGGLDLIGAGAPVAERLLHQRMAFGDQLAIPEAAILIFEQHDGALRIEARPRSRMLEKQERRQPHDLGLAREEPQQQAGEADRLLAQGGADMGAAAARRIALVEHQIDHRGDGGEALGPLDGAAMRAPLCDEAIRLARLLLRLFQTEPEVMGLTALLLLQHARAAARFDAQGEVVLLDDQDRSLWNQGMIAEGLALIDKAMRHRRRGPYQVQAAIAALHARAATPQDTDWAQIDLLYAALEELQPSPVVTLNRAVAVAKLRGPEAALAMIEPLAPRLSGYFHFFGAKGALLLKLGRAEEARSAFGEAIALANTPAEAAHIRMHLDRLEKDCAAQGSAKVAT